MSGIPKLSSLQAQLRKSPAPKPSSAASPSQGLKRPAEVLHDGAPANKMAAVGAPAPSGVAMAKPRIAKTAPAVAPTTMAPAGAKAAITKSAPPPGAAVSVKSPAPGFGMQAKLPPPAPPASQGAPAAQAAGTKKAHEIEDIKALQAKLAALKAKANSLQAELKQGGAAKAAGAAAKSSGPPERPAMPSMTKASVAPPVAPQQAKAAAPPVKRPPGTPPAPAANGQQPPGAAVQEQIHVDTATAEALKTFANGLKAHSGKSKLVLLGRLADAIHKDMSIEEISYFHKLCRKKVVERAALDGVQLSNPVAAPAKSAGGVVPAATKSAPGAVALTKSAAPAIRPSAVTSPNAAAPPRPAAPRPAAPTAVRPPQQPPTASVGSANGPSPSPPSSPLTSDGADALLALVAELSEDPVCEEGFLKEGRLNQVLKKLWDGVARTPRDWGSAFLAMGIPPERHAEVLQKFLNMAFVQTEGHEPEQAPMIIAELVKGHKVKMQIVEEVLVTFGHNLDGILAMNEEAWHVYAYVLLHVHPKPLKSGWGWSRVGWSWLGWWKFVEKCIASLEAPKAFEVLSMLLKLIQDREGTALAEVWTDGGKMKQVITKMGELGACPEQEVISKLSMDGVSVEVVEG